VRRSLAGRSDLARGGYRRRDFAVPDDLASIRRVRRRGQAMVEFALVLPIFLLILLIAVDFGRLFYTYVEMNNAAREAAAYGASHPTDQAGMLALAQQETNTQHQSGAGAVSVIAACHDSGGANLACANAPGGNGTGNSITVTVASSFTFLTPFVGDLFGGSLHMAASTTTKVLGLAASGGGSPGSCSTLPTAAFTATVVGMTVTVDASSSSPTTGLCAISGYAWDMGDGADPWPPIVGMNPGSYTYTVAGTYHIQLVVSNPAGNSSTLQVVNVGTSGPTPSPTPTPTPTPVSTPTPTPAPVCNTAPSFTYNIVGSKSGGYDVTYYGAYTGQPAPVSWVWAFGDGTSGSGPQVTHHYAGSAQYNVTLTVTNGTCVKSVTDKVHVK
jgi:Flp pilus assembly protein TadG